TAQMSTKLLDLTSEPTILKRKYRSATALDRPGAGRSGYRDRRNRLSPSRRVAASGKHLRRDADSYNGRVWRLSAQIGSRPRIFDRVHVVRSRNGFVRSNASGTIAYSVRRYRRAWLAPAAQGNGQT